jgi:outer membrane protein assembly factor BamD
LLQQYPNSILVSDVKTRLSEVQDNLGLHNLWIANFYYKRSIDQQKQGLKGSQSRYREILEKYPNFSYLDEVLFKIAVTYQAEEETDEAVKYFQKICREFPNSEYLDKAKEQLTLMGATIPPSDPTRQNVFPPEKAGFFDNFKNQFFGNFPMTIDRNGVLMTKDFDKKKFELIDQVIENGGDLTQGQIPKVFTTVVGDRPTPTTQQ